MPTTYEWTKWMNMPVGESSWLRGKLPVKFERFSTGGLFHKSGWYFMTGMNRFHLKSYELRKLFQEGKAYLIVDEHVIGELGKRYRGEKPTKAKPQVDPKVVQLEEFKRRKVEEAQKAQELAKRQQKEAMKRKKEAEKAAKKLAKQQKRRN